MYPPYPPFFTPSKPLSKDSSPDFHPIALNATASDSTSEWKYRDLQGEDYKQAIVSHLRTQRSDRYSHMTDSKFQYLENLVSKWSHCLVIDGVEPATIQGYAFDIETVPGAQPVRHQLPKLSPAEAERERYHVLKAERLGHLRVPTDAQKGEWTTKTMVVSKKDDPMGRWICDFRPLNRATKKRPTALGDVFTKTRALAAKRWKSALDAWSGFNQMGATERAKRLMQIITSLGLRQFEVMPFGVTNGPSYFQEFMLNLYGPHTPYANDTLTSEVLDNMLGDAMADLDACLEIWVDDLQVGTGDVCKYTSDESEDDRLFFQHGAALERVFERATVAQLRFKLDKCFLSI